VEKMIFMLIFKAQQRTDEADIDVGKLQLKVDKIKGTFFPKTKFSILFIFRKIG
jgi:hypothetical protein